MDEKAGGRPSIQPPCLIASAWRENPSVSHSVSPDTLPHDSVSLSFSPLLELLEREEKRAEERDRRAETREERLLNLLEKIVEKI